MSEQYPVTDNDNTNGATEAYSLFSCLSKYHTTMSTKIRLITSIEIFWTVTHVVFHSSFISENWLIHVCNLTYTFYKQLKTFLYHWSWAGSSSDRIVSEGRCTNPWNEWMDENLCATCCTKLRSMISSVALNCFELRTRSVLRKSFPRHMKCQQLYFLSHRLLTWVLSHLPHHLILAQTMYGQCAHFIAEFTRENCRNRYLEIH